MVTAAVQNVRMVVAVAMSRGVAPGPLLAAAGLDVTALLATDGRVPAEPALRAWTIAAERCADPWFGLSVADQLRPDHLGGLTLTALGSATLGDGLRRLSRYFHLVNQWAELRLVEDATRIRIRLEIAHGTVEALRHPTECFLATLLKVSRRAIGSALVPLEVAVRHHAPPAHPDDEPYRRAFGVLPRFGADAYEVVLPRAALGLATRTPDAALVEHGERHLRRLLDELPRIETITGQVRREILEELRTGEVSLRRIAARLRTSERTLQRRLEREGTSLHELLDEVRRRLALRHLAESRESIAEISFLLGFGEVRAFHRAFKRWTGSTPAAFRRDGAPALAQ